MDHLSSQLQAALYALNSHDTSAQTESNAWLNEFLQTRESWNACLRLYEHDSTPVIRSMCVSLLSRKVRMDWSGGWLTADERAVRREQCKSLYVSQMASASPDRLLIRQLTLLQVLCIDTDEHVRDAIQHSVEALAQPSTWYAGLEILLTIPTEFRDSSRRLHGKLLPVLRSYTQMVMDAVDRYLVQPGGDEAHRVCEVIQAWIELPSIPGGLPEIDLIGFSKRNQNIFHFLVGECFDKGTEPACGALLAALKGTFPEENVAEATLLFNGIISKMASIQHCLLQESHEEHAMAVAHLGSGIADCWVEGVAYVLPTCVDLAQIMLTCVKHPDHTVVETALEYFFAIDLIDVRQRNEHLRHPLQAQLVETLAQRLMFPQASTDESLEMMIREEGFLRLRKDIVPELLQEVYPLLNIWYLEWVLKGVKSSTWQEMEVALYMLQAPDLQIRTRALAVPDSSDEAAVHASETMHALLCETFAMSSSFCRSNLSRHMGIVAPVLGSTFSTVIERFAIWFGKKSDAPFDEVFAALLTILALDHSYSTKHVCTAIKSLCVRLGRGVISPESILSKMNLIKSGLVHLTLDVECEEELVEGMVHLAIQLEQQEKALSSLFDITSPYVDTIVHSSHLEYSFIDNNVFVKVMRSMLLIRTALKALLSTAMSQGGGWAAANLYKELHGYLVDFLQSKYWKNNSEAVDGVVRICKEAISSSRRNSGEILQLVLPMVMGIFHETLSSPALEVLSEVIEMHFNDPNMMNDIVALSHPAFQKAFAVLHDQGLSSRPALVRTLLDVGYSFIVYAPNSFIRSGSISVFTDLGIAALSCREPEILTHALQFLCYLPCAAADETIDKDSIDAINSNLMVKGPQLVEALLYAACETCPRSKVKSAANLVRALLLHPPLQGQGSAWLFAAISSDRVQNASKDAIGKESQNKFVELATGGTLNPQRLTCLITDYGLVCRREEEETIFSLAYEV